MRRPAYPTLAHDRARGQFFGADTTDPDAPRRPVAVLQDWPVDDYLPQAVPPDFSEQLKIFGGLLFICTISFVVGWLFAYEACR